MDEWIDILIAEKSDKTFSSFYYQLGKTALHYAAQHGFLDILKHFYESMSSSVTPSPTEVW